MSNETKAIVMKASCLLLLLLISTLSIICTYQWTIRHFDPLVAILLTAAVEGGLLLFSYKFYNESYWYVLMWVGFLVYSIVASRSSIMDKLIDSNQIKLHSSIEFKKYQSDSNTIDNQIAALQNRLSVLNNSTAQNNNTALNEINNKLVEKRANLTTIPVTQKTQRKRNDMQNEIDSLEKSKSELINIASSLNKSLSEKQTEANNIIKTLQELNNKKESLDKKLSTNTTTITNNISKEDEINYWTYFFIFLEIARCILWKDSKQKGYFSGNSTTFKDRLSKWLNPQIPTAVTASKENTIGFKYAQESHLTNKHSVNALQNTLETLSPTLEVNDIKISVPDALNKNDVKRYLEYMYDNAIGNISPGSNLIARQIGISTETARKIRALLEGHNVVKSDKSTKKTVILNYL